MANGSHQTLKVSLFVLANQTAPLLSALHQHIQQDHMLYEIVQYSSTLVQNANTSIRKVGPRFQPKLCILLQELGKATYILGIIGLAVNCASTVIAVLCAIRALCGRLGRGFICFSIPFRSALIHCFAPGLAVLSLKNNLLYLRTICTGHWL